MVEIKKRLLSRCRIEESCLIWTGSVDDSGKGYGKISYQSKYFTAHRLSYLLFKGEIPNNLCVCHTCDMRRCINPFHLFLGTKSDNAQDAIQKNRFKFNLKNNAKLNAKSVNEIREKYKTGNYTFRSLAKEYGINKTSVEQVIKFWSWKRV